jgi:hypothetical protein
MVSLNVNGKSYQADVDPRTPLLWVLRGRARSLRELAERDGITRRYVRRLVDLAFLSPELVEAILQGPQPVELTATRLTELDLPLDWADAKHWLLSRHQISVQNH